MKNLKKHIILTISAMAACLIIGQQSLQAEELGAEFMVEAPPPDIVSYQNYSGLSELITMICDDAIERFQGFYGPSIVNIEPFATLGEFQKGKQSKLGVTLADQMIAMINNDTLMLTNEDINKPSKGIVQRMNGVLEEVDGYLRIHISGVNHNGERLSYVANIEMSESIYRSMFAFL